MSRLDPVPKIPLRDDPTQDSIWKRWLEASWRLSTAYVGGPISGVSTDNAVARWDGIDGRTLQNSGVIIDDSNNASGFATLSADQVLLGTSITVPGANLPLAFQGDTDTGVYRLSSDTLGIANAGVHTALFDSSHRFVIGATTAAQYGPTALSKPRLQVHGDSGGNIHQAGIVATYWDNNNDGAKIVIAKSRGTTVGTHVNLQSGDELGSFGFNGSNNSTFEYGAEILCSVDGTPSSTSFPGSIRFLTTTAGSLATSLKWTIKNTGALLAGTDNSWDIGTTVASRPRTGYFGTSVITPSVTVGGLTSGRVPFVSTAGLLVDDSGFTFDTAGDILTVGAINVAGTTAPTSGWYLPSADLIRSPNSVTVDDNLTVSGTSALVGNVTVTGDAAVNGGDITTSQTTFNLLNATATTINFGAGASTSINMGHESATNTVLGLATQAQISTASTSVFLVATHTDNTSGTSNAVVQAKVAGTSGGDPSLRLTITGGSPVAWSVGVDNSDSDKLKIGSSGTVGTSTAITIDSSLVVTLADDLAIGKQVTTVNGVTSSGNFGVPVIVASGRATGQTAANTSVSAFSVGAADGSFEVSANVNVTASATHNFTVTCAYTDEGNTGRTLTLGFTQLSGATFLTAITNLTGAGPYESPVYHLRCKASTTITIATTGTFTSVTYNAEGVIKQTN